MEIKIPKLFFEINEKNINRAKAIKENKTTKYKFIKTKDLSKIPIKNPKQIEQKILSRIYKL